MTFLIALVLFGAAGFWLYRSSNEALDQCRRTLGFEKAGERRLVQGQSQEGFHYHQALLFEGVLDGLPAEVHSRTVSHGQGTLQRRRGSQFTLLTIVPAQPLPASFRLQPAGLLRAVEHYQQGAPEIVSTGDAAFDAAYHLYADDPAAAIRAVLSPVRQALLTFRDTESRGANMDSVAGKMASAFMLGSIEVTTASVSYLLMGSPSATIAQHLKRVAPVLVSLAGGNRRL